MNAEAFEVDFDAKNGFPISPMHERVEWQAFNYNIYSDEADPKEVLEKVCDEYDAEKLDLRPYIWEHPMTAYVNDPLHKVLELFRHHHLRHCCIMNPKDGALVGVITRKDLFAYMSL